MKQIFHEVIVKTNGPGLYDFTRQAQDFVNKKKLFNGILNINILHTSASLTIQENADPDVLKDLQTFYRKLVPMNGDYVHSSEGVDDMPAHIKSTLTNSNLTLSVLEGVVQLGIWQGIYLFEHREINKNRTILVHIFGN